MPKLMIDPGAVRQQPLRQREIGMRRERRDESTHAIAGCSCRELEHGRRVFHVPLHAHRQGLDALQQVEGIAGRHAGAEIAQAFGPRAHDEGRGPELLARSQCRDSRHRAPSGSETAGRLPSRSGRHR